MRLASINTADYDGAGTLRIDGVDAQQRPATVEISVPDKTSFLGFIQAVMYEKDMQDENSRTAFPATSIRFGAQGNSGDGFTVSISFQIATGGRMNFVLPVATQNERRVQAIIGHLEQALMEMGAVDECNAQ